MASSTGYCLRSITKRPISDKNNGKNDKKAKLAGENEASHKRLHNALGGSDIELVKELIESGVKLCHKASLSTTFEKTCYMLALESKNPELLKILLEYDPSGINLSSHNVNYPCFTLLMIDIKLFRSNHFQLLLDFGANINCPSCPVTALNLATLNPNTPTAVIKQLIELKADVNVVPGKVLNVNWDDPPLHSLLKSTTKFSNVFEKLKLLVEAGADVTVKNGDDKTPLMLASNIKLTVADINIMKYLFNKGAKIGEIDCKGHNTLHILMKAARPSKSGNIINSYLIPAFDLLVESGEDLFREVENLAHIRYSPLCLIYTAYSSHSDLKNLLFHVFKTALEKSINISIDESFQLHPFNFIIKKLNEIVKDKNIFKYIRQLILKYPAEKLQPYKILREQKIKEPDRHSWFWYKCWPNGILENSLESSNLDLIGSFVKTLPLQEIKPWLIKLKEKNFTRHNEGGSLFKIVLIRFFSKLRSLPITLLTSEQIKKEKMILLELIDYLIANYPEDINSMEMIFTNTELQKYQLEYKLPDCIFISAVLGNLECLKRFLPYWHAHPSTVFLFLRPFLRERLRYEHFTHDVPITLLAQVIPFLFTICGPITNDKKLMYRLLYKTVITYTRDLRLREIMWHYCEAPTDSPISLKIICRNVIRQTAQYHGGDLPSRLESLVPFGLRRFLTIREE